MKKIPATARKPAKKPGSAVAKAKDASASYNKFKDYKGQVYTGMAVGRTHHWLYDQASWKEKKVTPEKWEFAYSTVKRRKGKAPEGSGVPVGTGYHWFILAHQFVEKLNANDYMTQMVGLKFKLAHKRAAKGKWNASGEAQKKHLVQILKCLVAELEREPEQVTPVPLAFDYNGMHYEGTGVPVLSLCEEGVCHEIDVTLNQEHLGIIRNTGKGWKITEVKSQKLVNLIGAQIEEWYQEKAA